VGSSKGSKNPTKSSPAAPVLVQKWVVVQLTSLGEREKNISLIERSVRQILRHKEIIVFVPAISQKGQKDSLTTWYSDGYIFVQFIDGVPYHALQDTPYFSSVLSKNSVVSGSRKLVYSLLDDKDLDTIRIGMKALPTTSMKSGKFSLDDRVKIVKGNYKNLVGKISCIYEGNENVQVYVDLRSKKTFMDFPASYLEKLEER
jgi:transcription antitermination factor NusG